MNAAAVVIRLALTELELLRFVSAQKLLVAAAAMLDDDRAEREDPKP